MGSLQTPLQNESITLASKRFDTYLGHMSMNARTRFGFTAQDQIVTSAAGWVGGVCLIVIAPEIGLLIVTIAAWLGTAVAVTFFIEAWMTIIAAEREAERNANGGGLH